ncbi:unnamed protein product [Boreogadus saida]
MDLRGEGQDHHRASDGPERRGEDGLLTFNILDGEEREEEEERDREERRREEEEERDREERRREEDRGERGGGGDG